MPGLNAQQPMRRRTLLGLGSLALGGMSLPDVLAARQAQGVENSDRAVILVWLYGGPSQLETYDLKPLAPAEYRSQFSPIATNVPGFASWRKALLSSTKKPWNLPMSFRGERHDESGPLGALMAAEIVRASGPGFVSKMCAMHARGNLIGCSSIAAPACYREECRELASGEGFVSKCLLQVVATMHQLSPADIEALAGLLVEVDLVDETHAPALELAALRARAENSPAPAATEALLALWRAGLRSWIEQRLQQIAGIPDKPAGEVDANGDVRFPRIPRLGTELGDPNIEAESNKARTYK